MVLVTWAIYSPFKKKKKNKNKKNLECYKIKTKKKKKRRRRRRRKVTPWVYVSFINMEEVGIRKVVKGELDGWGDWQ